MHDPEWYNRDIDILENAHKMTSFYLHKNTNVPLNDCLEYCKRKYNSTTLTSKKLKILRRNNVGDRVKDSVTIDKWLSNAKKKDLIVAPNMVLYDPITVHVPGVSKFIKNKKKIRAAIKYKGMIARLNKDYDTADFCNNGQTKAKVGVNSISGAYGNPHNPLFNQTGHSTLTSASRVATTYANANTEKFVCGNRHYYSYDITLENISSICVNTDYVKLKYIVDKYNLHLPTVDEAINVIKYSTDLYWRSNTKLARIYTFLQTLSPLELAAFVYTGDLYHLCVYNQEFIFKIISETIVEQSCDVVENFAEIINSADEDIVALVNIFCADILNGNTVSKLMETSMEGVYKYCNTIINIDKVLFNFYDFFKIFFTTTNVPHSIYEFPSSLRRSVIGSDTDSVMYTVQNWVGMYFGDIKFDLMSRKVGNFIGFLNSQAIRHIHATVFKNIGVDNDQLFDIKMKNEYEFLLYGRANRAKHYITWTTSREGLVFQKAILDLKGVAMKDSKKSKLVMTALANEIDVIFTNIVNGKKMKIYTLMQRVSNLEHVINQSLLEGETKYLGKASIGPMHTYKKPLSTAYLFHDLWVTAFQHKYGRAEQPPYAAVKISVNLSSKIDINQWIQKQDQDTALLLEQWFIERGKNNLSQLLLPRSIFMSKIHKDFIPIMDNRKIISELMEGFYILLEMFGIYIRNDKRSIMLYDDMSYKPNVGLPGEPNCEFY